MTWRWILVGYAVASVVAFVAYGLDKGKAGRGERRIPEGRLHAIELLGGWPGALVGARIFRHKTRKGSYRIVRAMIVLAHLAVWGWWFLSRH